MIDPIAEPSAGPSAHPCPTPNPPEATPPDPPEASTPDLPGDSTRRGSKRPRPEGRKTLSYQLREIVPTLGKSTHEVARGADVDHKVLSRFLSGERRLTMATADRLAVAYGLKLGETFARPRVKARPRTARKQLA